MGSNYGFCIEHDCAGCQKPRTIRLPDRETIRLADKVDKQLLLGP
jgi:hypothetical protein